MKIVKVTTQTELDAALTNPNIEVWLVGTGRFEISDSAQVTAYNSARVTAYGSAQVTASDSARVTAYDSARVTASGSAQVTASGSARVTAYDSARVTAYGSAQVTAYNSARVTAYDSARVTASGSAQVTAYGSARVTASRYVAVTVPSQARVKVDGGVKIEIPPITTPELWCEFYGVPIREDGTVVLYKAVRDNWRSARGGDYTPGTTPSAPDWDGGKAECGGGLHFSPQPWRAKCFDPDATRFVACPILLSEIVVHYPASYPEKVKAPRVYAPIWACDEDGKALQDTERAA